MSALFRQSLHSSTPPRLLLSSSSVFVPGQTGHLIAVRPPCQPRTVIMICNPFKTPLLSLASAKTELAALTVISALALNPHALPSYPCGLLSHLLSLSAPALYSCARIWAYPSRHDVYPAGSPLELVLRPLHLSVSTLTDVPPLELGLTGHLSWICALKAVLFSPPSRTHTLAEPCSLNSTRFPAQPISTSASTWCLPPQSLDFLNHLVNSPLLI